MSLDISPSNQCLAFGDTSNSLHLYSSVPEPILNPYARDSEFADPIEHLPSMDITDDFANYASIPRPHLSVGQNNYCSDFWPERFMKQAYRPTPEIDSDILKSMKIVGTIGYARNLTNAKRNVVRYPNLKTKQVDSTTNFRSHHGSHGGEDQENTHQGTGAPSAAMNLIPKYYRLELIIVSILYCCIYNLHDTVSLHFPPYFYPIWEPHASRIHGFFSKN